MFFKKTGKEKPAQMATDDSNDEFLALESENGMCLWCFVLQSKWKSDIDSFHYMSNSSSPVL